MRKKYTHNEKLKIFWNQVNKIPNGCWEWTGSTYGRKKCKYGYLKKQTWGFNSAHRFSYFIHNGQISNLGIAHKCDNTLCVNPKHLELKTQYENMQDCKKRNRLNIRVGEKHHNVLLNEKQVKQIRNNYKPHVITINMLAEKYKVSNSTIQSIIYCKNWKHL